jgi:drug/metabolite transporter (DMT)-like permease
MDRSPETTRAPLEAHAALALAQVLFAIFPVVTKRWVFPAVEPLGVAGLRVAFGAASLALAARIARAPSVPDRASLLRLAVCAFFGVAVNQVFFLVGLSRSTAIHAAVLVAATPAIAYAIAVVAGRETRHPASLAGVVLAGAGAVLIALARPPSGGQPTLRGDALLVVNVTSYSVYLVLVRDVVRRVHPLRAIAWVFAFGALMVLPLSVPTLVSVEWRAVGSDAWLGIAFILLGPTSGAYLLNAWALRRSSSTLAAVYTCAQPLITTAIAWESERPDVLKVALAIGLIIPGVLLVALPRRAR